MLQPHLLPDAGDLARFAAILLVAACTAGLGFLSGARALQTAFFSGWGFACLIFVALGTWTSVDLGWAAALVAMLGAAGLVRMLLRRTGAGDAGAGIGVRVLVLGLPFLVLVLGMADIAWDDLAFWVPNLLHLDASHRFPSLADPAIYSAMAAYPYGMALPGFAVHLLGFRQVDTVAPLWNLLAMLAAGAAFADILAQRLRWSGHVPTPGTRWALAGLGVLLMGMASPTFVAKILLSNMGDSATGAGLAVLYALLFRFAAEPTEAPGQENTLAQIALTASAVMFVRQANAALLLILFTSTGAGLLLYRSRGSAAAVARLLAALVLPAVIWWAWTRYADREIPNGRHFLLPFHAWHWSIYGETLRTALHVYVEKSGYAVMSLGMGCIAVRCLLRRFQGRAPFANAADRPAAATMATASAGLAFGNIAFLLFCYLATSFDPTEAEAAISFWRFIGQTGQSLLIGFACIVPATWMVACLRSSLLRRALPVASLLLPVVATGTYRDDLRSPVPTLRRIADDLHDSVPADRPITLVDVDGNGFAAIVVRYQLRAIDGDASPLPIIAFSHGLTAAEAQKRLPEAAPYVWLAEGSAAFGDFLGARTRADCSYLFRYEDGQYRVVQSWAIGPYHWAIHWAAASSGGRDGCRG